MKSAPSRPRVRRDWVYRANSRLFGIGTAANDLLGSYEPLVTTVNSGVTNAQTRILYDSQNYLASISRGGIGSGGTVATVGVIKGAARAEGRKPCIHAVEGIIHAEPTVWAFGNVMALGVRIGTFEQDLTGVFSVDAEYSMWTNGISIPGFQPADFANNTRNNAWERRTFKFFGDASTTPNMLIKVSWRGKKYLEANECFGMYLEVPSTAVNLRTQCWVRSLVADEG